MEHGEGRKKTAFITSRFLFEFCVMYFVLCNVTGTYQRTIDNLLQNAAHSEYVDDTLMYYT